MLTHFEKKKKNVPLLAMDMCPQLKGEGGKPICLEQTKKSKKEEELAKETWTGKFSLNLFETKKKKDKIRLNGFRGGRAFRR